MVKPPELDMSREAVAGSGPDHGLPGPVRRPRGLMVLVTVNAVAAIILLIMSPLYPGGRGLLYLCAGILHAVLALGLFRAYNWARVIMIIYALFQAVGMSLWSLIGLMTLAVQPMTAAKAGFLGFALVAVPFLVWSVVYLLRQLRGRDEATT